MGKKKKKKNLYYKFLVLTGLKYTIKIFKKINFEFTAEHYLNRKNVIFYQIDAEIHAINHQAKTISGKFIHAIKSLLLNKSS